MALEVGAVPFEVDKISFVCKCLSMRLYRI